MMGSEMSVGGEEPGGREQGWTAAKQGPTLPELGPTLPELGPTLPERGPTLPELVEGLLLRTHCTREPVSVGPPATLTKNSFNAIVTGRLIPGGRTPVIVALGLSRFPVRRFVLADTVACALWAAIYSTLGSIGGRIAHHPVWAMVVAITFATSIGVLVQKIHALWTARRARAALEANVDASPSPEADQPPAQDTNEAGPRHR